MTERLSDPSTSLNAEDHLQLEEAFHAQLSRVPSDAETRYRLAKLFGEQGKAIDAVREMSLALEAAPEMAKGWAALCDFAERIGQYELSSFAGSHAVRLEPKNASFWLSYGIALNKWGRNEEAINAYRTALKIDPTLSSAAINLSVAYMNEGKPLEAEAAAKNGIKTAVLEIASDTPNIDEALYSLPYWHLSLAELALGKYREGFAHMRARYKGSTDWKRFNDPHPLWRGENIFGKCLLVRVEQGHGDALMLARYLPLLRAKGARVLFQVHPALVSLFTREQIADKVLSMKDKVSDEFDWHTTIFDLPHIFATTIETIPDKIPYISKPPFSAKTEIGDAGYKVGFISAGQNHPAHDRLRSRSIPLSQFLPLFELQDITFINLTTDQREGDRDLLSHTKVKDMSPVIHDFLDTAEIMSQLDLVISCDTATAHLAGAMGLNVLTLLSSTPDWRWLMKGDRSPWYPSMRLLRQTTAGDWQSVINTVKEFLLKAPGAPSTSLKNAVKPQ